MMSGILEYEVTVVDSIRQLIYFGDGAAGPTGIYLSVFGALTSLFDVCRLKKSALFVVATPLYDESSDESRTVYQTKLIQAGLNSVCQSIITIDSTHRLSFTQRDNVEIQVHDSDDISIITTPQKRKEMRQSFAPVYNDREADPFIGV
jgi:hypothetical protein